MNNRTGYGLRIVLGGYLAYLGIRMLIQTVSEKPANMMFMGAMAVLFTVVGIAYVAYSVKKALELKKAEQETEQESEPEQETEPKPEEEAVEQSEADGPAEDPEETQETEEIENDYEEK